MRYRKSVAIERIADQAQPPRQAWLKIMSDATQGCLRTMNHERMHKSKDVVADLWPLIHATLEVIRAYSQRAPGKQHHRPMHGHGRPERNRKSHRPVKIHRRGFDRAAGGLRRQGDNACFDEIDMLDPTLRLLQHRALFQGNKFEEGTQAIKIDG
jgi:hypothetical protein